MEHPQHALLQIVDAAEGVAHVAEVVAAQADGDRVDGEVPPAQVLLQGRGLHLRQRARLGVGLPARGGQVEAQAVPGGDRGGAEALVPDSAAVEHVGQLLGRADRVALDGQVQVEDLLVEQEVAHRAPHEVDRGQRHQQRQQPLHARDGPQPLAQAVHQRRTGTPASRMRSLASRTVVCP